MSPQRSPAGQRLYSDRDIARLLLLRRATLDGHSIGAIAPLDDRALEALLDTSPAAAESSDVDLAPRVHEAMSAVERLDAGALEATLRRAAMALGATTFVDAFAPRLLIEVGEHWHLGELGPAHEHLATSTMRRVLDWVIEAFVVAPRAPKLVVATPAGERHELGAMLVSAAAVQEGWRVIYLGADLPAAQIVHAASQVRARAVALSVVAAAGRGVTTELRAVARGLAEGTSLLLGGRAAEQVEAVPHARVLADIAALRRALRAIRSVSEPAAHPSES